MHEEYFTHHYTSLPINGTHHKTTISLLDKLSAAILNRGVGLVANAEPQARWTSKRNEPKVQIATVQSYYRSLKSFHTLLLRTANNAVAYSNPSTDVKRETRVRIFQRTVESRGERAFCLSLNYHFTIATATHDWSIIIVVKELMMQKHKRTYSSKCRLHSDIMVMWSPCIAHTCWNTVIYHLE